MNTWEIVAHSDLQTLVDELLHCGSHTLTYTTRYLHCSCTHGYENFLSSREDGRMVFGDKPNPLKQAFLAVSNSITELKPTNDNIFKL
jgi:hypothetical protein